MDLGSVSVGLLQCRDYGSQRLSDALERLWPSSGISGNFRSAAILLKPNLISARRGVLACTEADFILAAARWFLDQGSRVTVGDSPAFGTAEAVLAKLGIDRELGKMGVGISNFRKIRKLVLPSGIKAGLAADALECDLLVNLPRVKAHVQLCMTLAVKNYFGCLPGFAKPWWHMVHGGRNGRFASLIVELLSVLPNSISLVDGITAMHQTGPMGGKPFPLGIIASATNPVAVDRALHEIVDVPLQCSPILQACRDAGLNGSRFDALHFPLMSPGELKVAGFEVPADLSPIRFNPFHFLRSGIRRMLLRLGI